MLELTLQSLVCIRSVVLEDVKHVTKVSDVTEHLSLGVIRPRCHTSTSWHQNNKCQSSTSISNVFKGMSQKDFLDVTLVDIEKTLLSKLALTGILSLLASCKALLQISWTFL